MQTSHFDVIVIGGGVAGIQAAIEAKKLQPGKSVALFSDEKVMYPRPSLTAVISGSVRDSNRIKIFSPQSLVNLDIQVFSRFEISKIENSTHTILARKKENQRKRAPSFTLTYDKLIIATGANPSIPKVKGRRLHGVFTIRRFEEALATSNYISSGMTAHVIGAGFVGLDAAETLARRGLSVTLIVRSRILRGILEQDLSEALIERAQKHRVKILSGVTLESIEGKKKVEHVIVGGKKLKTDVVIFAIGVDPETELAQSLCLATGPNGAIKTDQKMQTSLNDIYATGDCSESIDFISQKHVYRPLGSTAALTAQIAAANAVGVRKSYRGILRKQYNRIFDTEIVSVGLSTEEARTLNIKARAIKCTLKKPQMLPFHHLTSQNMMRLIVNEETNVIIGWQTIGLNQSCFFNHYLLNCIYNRTKLEDIESSGLKIDMTFEKV